MGRFAAVPTIAKCYEKTMMMYYDRFKKDDPNVNKELIAESLNEKHEVIAKMYKFDPKWALRKEDINAAIQRITFGNEQWNILE